jgi:hypothetical protein
MQFNKNLKLDIILSSNKLKFMDWKEIFTHVGEGLIIELGVYQGQSFNEICSLAHPRKVYGFDWFRGLPEAWRNYPTDEPPIDRELDMQGVPPSRPDNGEFVIGRIEDTLPEFLLEYDTAPAFVHFDMDIYSSTKHALEILTRWLQPGSILVFDEIDGAVRNINHEQKAFREWLDSTDRDFELLGRRHGEAWVVRLK